jgi:lycopene beta-cyclase
MTTASAEGQDVVLVGGGLSSSLIAMRLKASRPDLRIRILEKEAEPDDSHTWCCFNSDLEAQQATWLHPLMCNRWPDYEVRFPDVSRRLTTGYNRLSSGALVRARRAALADSVVYGAEAVHVSDQQVVLADGATFEAPLVIDGRGATPSPHVAVAFQKFVGLEVELARPHGLARPLVMDGAVRQLGGFRFFYVLPLNDRRLLIEDTRYTDGAELHQPELATEVRRYAQAHGWTIVREVRQEAGVLPILLGGSFDAYWSALGNTGAPVGMRALLFHPTTGYSLPFAARLADRIAALPILTTALVRALVEKEARSVWRSGAYLRLLNRMLFQAAAPDRRFAVLQRFYRLPQPLIERFYANHLTWGDRARILSGRPPVPIRAAVRAIRLKPQEVSFG